MIGDEEWLEDARRRIANNPEFTVVRLEIDGVVKHGWIRRDLKHDKKTLRFLVKGLIKSHINPTN